MRSRQTYLLRPSSSAKVNGHGSTLASIGRSFLTSCSCSAMFAVAITTRFFSWCAW
ncbi:MAG: hypothetical protein IT376_06280 [Polyangiaceae bacterium]|nr:hypothetical protein [Polyangiaceae bacterium]